MSQAHTQSQLPHKLCSAIIISACVFIGAGQAVAQTPSPAKAKPEAPSPAKDWCKVLAISVPGLTQGKCTAASLQTATVKSVEGRPLSVRDIQPRSGPAKLKILVLGAIHGDEVTSASLVFDWIERARGSNSNDIHWRMLPLVNPDGLFKKPATRVNAHGIDLNRNFPTNDWKAKAQQYWAHKTGSDPRRYPGTAPLSEPESRWVHNHIDGFKPDLIVSVHAPYGVLDFDGPPPPPSKLGGLYLDQVGVYPGSLGNYGGVDKNVPVITVELKNALEPPSVEERDRMWSDLTTWIDNRLLKSVTPTAKAEENTTPATASTSTTPAAAKLAKKER